MRATLPLLAMPLAACVIASPGTARPPAAAPPPPSAATVEDGVLNEANRLRGQAGLRRLERSDPLDRAAREHARELARRGELDHASREPERATLDLRLRLAGVTAWRRIGENLALLQNPTIEPGRQIAQLWLRSAPHRANLLEPSYDRVGTGVVRAADGTWYAVQVYGRGIETQASR